MKTIAQQIKWDFKANGSLEIYDKNGKLIYLEDYDGFWRKWEHDSQSNLIYLVNSNGDWEKFEYDSEGNEIYWENSDGEIRDNRPKSCEGKIVEFDGEKYKLVKV